MEKYGMEKDIELIMMKLNIKLLMEMENIKIIIIYLAI